MFQVDGVNLENKTNLEAVEVLKKTGAIVKMKLARPKDSEIPQRRKRSSGNIEPGCGKLSLSSAKIPHTTVRSFFIFETFLPPPVNLKVIFVERLAVKCLQFMPEEIVI